MFYWQGFVTSFVIHVVIGLVGLAVGIVVGPVMQQVLGGTGAAVVIVLLVMSARFAGGLVSARPMWEKQAPVRRVVVNLVPSAVLGFLVVFGALTAVAGGSVDGFALVGFVVDLVLCAFAVLGGALAARGRLRTAES
ncbi:hypothetical protein ACUXNS_000478 [Brevibacterium pityocampae]